MIGILLQSVPPVVNSDPSLSWLFVKTILAMVIIIALAFVSIRFLLPKLSRYRGAPAKEIDVIGYRQLDARKAVYILRMRGRDVAVGVTENSMTPLTEWREKESGNAQ